MKLDRLFLVLVALAIAACSSSNGGPGLVDKTAQAMGGSAALQAVQTQKVVASGTWFEPEQTFRPGNDPLQVSTFSYTLSYDLAADRLRYDWSRDISYPFVATQVYAEVIDRDQGLVTGSDGSGPTPAAMPSVRVATVRKESRLTSPLVLIRSAVANPAVVEIRPDEAFEGKSYHVLALTGEQPRPIRLFIDPDSFLPAKADTLEDDPYYGDTLHEILYADWRQQGAIMTPFHLTQRLTGLGRTITLQNEVRSTVENDITLTAEQFAIPAGLRVVVDAADTARGERMAQWFLRRQAIGIPGFTDQGTLSVAVSETRPGSGVFFVTGGTHNSLIVERPDHLIVVEPALYESRSLAVIAQIKTRFPGKPIRYVIVSHFHNDHGGGVRTYAAEGATVVAGEASRTHFEAILAAPHTVFPDLLQNHPVKTEVLAVPSGGGLQLSGGAMAVYSVTDQTHAADMVVPFVPAEGLLFVSDLFSPAGATVAAADIPAPLQQTFSRFNLTVTTIAGGHGTIAAVR
jgi:glyoxylase-like metal-dependent hydrolase (beta-lactamase superfamily II)